MFDKSTRSKQVCQLLLSLIVESYFKNCNSLKTYINYLKKVNFKK